jgi:rubredoxin
MKQLDYQHIKIKAGRIGLERFRLIIKTLIRFQVDKMAIGEQQTLYFLPKNEEESKSIQESIEALNFRFQTAENFNLVSSIPAIDIVASTPWLHSGVYAKISQNFPKIKPLSVRIVDPAQRLVSLFGSQINFVASESINFWYLYVRLNDGNYFLWPVMINSNSVGDTYKILSQLLIENPNLDKKSLLNSFNNQSETISTRSFLTDPKIESMEFPNYDGIHFTGNDYWFGFGGANGYFKTTELDAFCVLLEQIEIKEIYLNIRGGFILKGIKNQHIALLNQWIKQSSFKTGRAFNELGWQYDALNQKEQKLKEKFTKELAKRGNENYGFSVKLTHSNLLNLEKEDTDYVISYSSMILKISLFDQFQLFIKQSKNPADGIYRAVGTKQSFGQVAENLYAKLLSASKYQVEIIENKQEYQDELAKQINPINEYVCSECGNVYNPELGDTNQGISVGTEFDSLPEKYACFVCGAEKKSFGLV